MSHKYNTRLPVSNPHGSRLLVPTTIVLTVLVLAGAGHRTLLARIEAALGQVHEPIRPLATVPLQLGNWHGVDEPIDEQVRRIAGDDDALNRIYRRTDDGGLVGVYVGYIGRPRQWLGHRPDVCYRAHGYEPLAQESDTLPMPDGTVVPCFIYEFRLPAMGGPRQLVLATYIVNGEFVASLDAVREMNARRVDLSGSRPTYLARIQVNTAATGERARDLRILQDFAAQLQGPVLELLPRLAEE
ncbi:MAG: EpsI family protein [Phycisphaerae bacterium]|nr:EpsI family protein [Phycisphaerae bacterium]